MDEVRKGPSKGFSLLELLTVISITIILVSLASIGVSKIIPALELNRGGQMVNGTISAARQQAATLNREIQVIFLEIPDGSEKFWSGMQLWRVDETPNGQTVTPITPLQKLPSGVVFNARTDLSPLLSTDPLIKGVTSVGAYQNVQYCGFRFRAGGTPDPSIKAEKNFVTLNNRNDTLETPRNFYTLQLNPITGRAFVFRP